jgi:hypothetical protein
MHIFYSKNFKRREHLRELGVDARREMMMMMIWMTDE